MFVFLLSHAEEALCTQLYGHKLHQLLVHRLARGGACNHDTSSPTTHTRPFTLQSYVTQTELGLSRPQNIGRHPGVFAPEKFVFYESIIFCELCS